MAQYSKNRGNYFGPQNLDLHEVIMVSNKDGEIVTTQNRFPVDAVIGGAAGYSTAGNLSTQIDAFGRLRVSEPYTVFDNSFTTGDDTRKFETDSNGTLGTTLTHLANESTMAMDVGADSGDGIFRQTTRMFTYQPGKSLLVLNTFVMNEAKTNLRQRVGYFNDKNGIFNELDDSDFYIVKRSYITGSAEDTRIPQSSWNTDTLDGSADSSNPSGILLDTTKAQIQWMDLEWLGVGSVRTGFIINGQFIVTHIFHHANTIDSVYMTTATLPVRYEIENKGPTSGTSRLKHICNSIMSEGGYQPIVETRSASTSLAGLILSQTEFRPLISIRLKSAYDYAVVIPTLLNLYGLQSNAYGFKILTNATVTGGSWVSAGDESTVEYNITATALTGGRNVMQGLFMGGDKGAALMLDLNAQNSRFQLKRNMDGTTRNFTIAAIATNNNDYAIGSITWGEHN